ncbi:MAG TPA: hypothetical protein VF181_07390 [Balneolaceae bacterium]
MNLDLFKSYGFSGSAYFDIAGITYDDAGNILSLQRDEETGSLIYFFYNYNGINNQLQSVADAVSLTIESWDAEDGSFGYDANGNLISQSDKFSDIDYNQRNLPVTFTLENGSELIAAYNAPVNVFLKKLRVEHGNSMLEMEQEHWQ